MMLKTAKSVCRNLKSLPAYGTWHFITRSLVLEAISKAFETEGVKTRKRLWIDKQSQTDRTGCEISSNWCYSRRDAVSPAVPAVTLEVQKKQKHGRSLWQESQPPQTDRASSFIVWAISSARAIFYCNSYAKNMPTVRATCNNFCEQLVTPSDSISNNGINVVVVFL